MKQKTKKKINLIVDTREQQPLLFEDYPDIVVMRDKLECGDYAPVAFDMPNDDYSLIIERKLGAIEVLTSIGSNWIRFERELEQLSKYKNKFLIICGPEEYYDLYRKKFTKIHPNFVRKRFYEIRLKYGVHIIHFMNRKKAEEFIYNLIINTIQLSEADDEK